MARTELEQLVYQMSADIRQLERTNNKALGIVDRDARKIQKRYDDLASGVGTAMGKMSLMAGTAFGALVGYSIKAASDAGEMQNAFEKAFGTGSDAAKAYAETLAKSVGRSVLETQENMQKLRLQLKQLDAQQADAITRALAARAVDVGSLYNFKDAEVLDKFLSGLRGESDPVEAFGVSLGEAAMKAELLRLGFKGVASDAPEATKMIARANIILRDTNIAAGDAASTIGSTANQAKKLQGEFRDAAAAMGERFLPAATKVLESANDLVGAFNDLPTGVQNAGLAMLGLIAATGPIMGLVTGFGKVVAAANAARTAMIAAGVGTGLGAALGGAAVAGAAVVGTQLVAGGVILARESDRKKFAADPKSATDDQLKAAIEATKQLPLVGDNRGPVMYRAQLKALNDELQRRAKTAAPTTAGGALDPKGAAQELAGFGLSPSQKVAAAGEKKPKDKGRVVIWSESDLKTVIDDKVFSILEDMTSDPADPLNPTSDFTDANDNPYIRAWDDAQEQIENGTWQAIRGGLDAAIYGGWPGLAEYMADSLKRRLADNLADVLTSVSMESGGGWLSKGVKTFAGLFDAGGNIGSGQWGIAGERGPEIVKGPATVIGRVQSAAMLSAAPRALAPNNVQLSVHVNAEGAIHKAEIESMVFRGSQMAVQAARGIVPADIAKRSRNNLGRR